MGSLVFRCMPKYQNTPKRVVVRHGLAAPHRIRSKKEEQEFGKAFKEFVVCPICKSAFFDKSWHHALGQDAKHFKKSKAVKSKICPACKMKKEKRYEGEIILKIKNETSKIKDEILNSIKNSDKLARERDPMDRVLWIQNKKDGLHIYTSENQLAVKIGKKIKSSFGKGKLKIVHSQEEDVTRVYFEV